jgi:mono/diheme cytochrome c family protein
MAYKSLVLKKHMTTRSALVAAAIGLVAIAVVIVAVEWPAKSMLSGAGAAHVGSAELAEYTVRLSDCVACHSVPDGKPFAGGLVMGTPLGTIYSTNITPDSKTGIGSYDLADFDNAVRRGIARDGHRLYPAMPFPSYAKLSDDDVKIMYQFFRESVAPVEQPNKPTAISWPLNMRWPLAIWSRAFVAQRPYAPNSVHDAGWNRGAYLVQGPGHCGACHTPRGLGFQEVGMDESHPHYLAGAALDGWKASSLRGEMDVGLGRWSEADIVEFLKNGHNGRASVYGSMMDAFNNSTQFMSNDDLSAIAHYLKSLPPDASNSSDTYAYDPKTADELRSGGVRTRAAQRYLTNCVWCHGRDGKGLGDQLAALAGNPSVLDTDPSSVVNIILNGAGRVINHDEPDKYRMYPFRRLMSDDDVAAVATFVRTSWGNKAPPVPKDDVTKLRAQTEATSGRVIILQMR